MLRRNLNKEKARTNAHIEILAVAELNVQWSIPFRRFWCLEDSVDWVVRFIFSPFHAPLVLTTMSWFITRINNGWDRRMGFNFLSSRNLLQYLHDNALSSSLPLTFTRSPGHGCTDAAVCRAIPQTSMLQSTYRKKRAKYMDHLIAVCPCDVEKSNQTGAETWGF